jgi:hypothetical protein
MGRIAKIARVKAGKVVSITVCDIEQADEQARMRGVDSWFEIDPTLGTEVEQIRTLEVGDALVLKAGAKAPAPGKQLAKTSIDKITKVDKVEIGQVEAG